MRLIACILFLIMVISLAEAVDLGGTTEKAMLLGSLSKNALDQMNTSNETEILNQTNLTNQGSNMVAIKNPMSIIPVSNKFKSVHSPNSIQANSVAYKFTT